MADGCTGSTRHSRSSGLLPDMQQVQELVAHPRNVFFEHGPAVVEILPVPGLHPLLEDKEAPFERRREVFDGVGHTGHGFAHDGDPVGFQQFRVREATSSSRCSVWRRICSRREYCSAARFSECSSRSSLTGLAMKSAAPRRRHSTALSMSPCPVIMTTCVVGILVAYPFEQGQAVHARHTDVGDHDGEGIGGERLQRFAGALGGVDVIAEIPDQGPEDMADAGFIINEQNANGSVHAVSLLQEICSGCGPETPPALFPSAARSGRDPRAG